MKSFFDSIFIDEDKLEDAGIHYPIKLEYYIIVDEEDVEARYGIKIVKTEFKNGNIKVESNAQKHIANSVKEIEEILSILRNNEVTPIGMEEVIEDMFLVV